MVVSNNTPKLSSLELPPRNGVTVGVEFGGAAILEPDSGVVPLELVSLAMPLEIGPVRGDMLTVVVVVVVLPGIVGVDVVSPASLDAPTSVLLGTPEVEVEAPMVIASADELAAGGGGGVCVETC